MAKFFKRLKKRARAHIKKVGRLAGRFVPVIAPVVGGVLFGPAGAAAGTAVGAGVSRLGTKSGRKARLRRGLAVGIPLTAGLGVAALATGSGITEGGIGVIGKFFKSSSDQAMGGPDTAKDQGFLDEYDYAKGGNVSQSTTGFPSTDSSVAATLANASAFAAAVSQTGTPGDFHNPQETFDNLLGRLNADSTSRDFNDEKPTDQPDADGPLGIPLIAWAVGAALVIFVMRKK